jgi:hypothetical protein
LNSLLAAEGFSQCICLSPAIFFFFVNIDWEEEEQLLLECLFLLFFFFDREREDEPELDGLDTLDCMCFFNGVFLYSLIILSL